MTAADATRLAGEAYRTRLARGEAAMPDDKTRLAQEGYQSRLARDAAGAKPEKGEFYTLGEKIGDRYEVSAIHHGELGVVYGCFDHQTKLPRALKTVRSRHAADKQVLSLFESEAAVWISLEKHPYIVRAYLVERFKNLPYVITEYVRGPEGIEGDLRGWLGHPRMTLPVAVAMALQIAQGMQHAVRKVPNFVHRDLKPGNVLVNGDGKAMVTDFGLVYAAQSGAGTPAYMSPEQWREEVLDARSDIYAYGCILFEMFTGHRLFPALTERDWESAHLTSSPVALNGILSVIPGEIDQFVRRCLAKEPHARPQNWDEIVAFFADWYHQLTGKAVVLDFSSLALDANEWISASYSLSNLERHEEMLLACDRAIAIDQKMAVAWRNKGIALRHLNRYEEAIHAYDRALAIDPEDVVAWECKGEELNRLKRYAEMVEAFDHVIEAHDRVLATNPNNADAWAGKGKSLYKSMRHEDAIQACDRALAIDPNNAAAWHNKGWALRLLKREEESIQAFERELLVNPDATSSMWVTHGIFLSKGKRYEEAIQAYDRAIAIEPNADAAWMCKCSILSKLERYEEVIQVCEQACEIDPVNSNEWWCLKGDALRELDRNQEAIEAYDRALAFDQSNTDAWISKGDMLQSLKRYDEAIEMYVQALNIGGNDESALKGFLSASEALEAAK